MSDIIITVNKEGSGMDWQFIVAMLTIIGSTIAIVVNIVLAKKQRTADIVTKNRMEWILTVRQTISDYYSKVKLYEDKQTPENISDFLNELYISESKIKLLLNCFNQYDLNIINFVTELNKSYDAFLHKKMIMERNSDRMEITREMIEYIETYNKELIDSLSKEFIDKYNMNELRNNRQYEELVKIFNDEKKTKERIISLLKMEDDYSKECCQIIRYLPEVILIYIEIYLKVEWERVKEEAERGNIKNFSFNQKFLKYLKLKEDEIVQYKTYLPKRVFE